MMMVNTVSDQDKELMDLIDTWVSGGFQDSYPAAYKPGAYEAGAYEAGAYEAFKELLDKRHKATTEACATAVGIKLEEEAGDIGSLLAQACLNV